MEEVPYCLYFLNHGAHFSTPSTNYAKSFPLNLASKFPSSMVSVTHPCKLTGQYCFLLVLTNEFTTSYLEDFKIPTSLNMEI